MMPPVSTVVVSVKAGCSVPSRMRPVDVGPGAVCVNRLAPGAGAIMRACCVIGAPGTSSWCRVPLKPTNNGDARAKKLTHAT